MIDFEKFTINCSQIGSLMGNARHNTPPTASKIKKLFGILGRDYGEMSENMKFNAREILTKAIMYDPNRPSQKILTEMVCIYAYEMYGKNQISKGNDSPHQLEKANMAEPESIRFLSKIDGIEYAKNEELFKNKWFKGVPDILCRNRDDKIEKIIEVKTSYDLPSFIIAQLQSEKSSNFYEVLGYMDLTGCKNAEIVHVLVDMPDKIASYEKKRLLERYQWLQLGEDIITERILNRMNDMTYEEIPDELKIFRRSVSHNKFTLKAVKSRATKAKKWMSDIHDSFTKNKVNLLEIEPDNQEDNI